MPYDVQEKGSGQCPADPVPVAGSLWRGFHAPAVAVPVVSAENTAAAPAESAVPLDARASLDKAFDQLAEVKNGTYESSLVVTTPLGSANLESDISFILEPYTRAKGEMAFGFALPGAPEFQRDLAYYIRETEQATAFYCRLGHGEWEKSVTARQPHDKKVNEFWAAAFHNASWILPRTCSSA